MAVSIGDFALGAIGAPEITSSFLSSAIDSAAAGEASAAQALLGSLGVGTVTDTSA